MNNSIVSCLAGMGAALAIAVLTYTEAEISELTLVMAPFGATTVLVFGLPDSPLARPKNVVFGHLLTAFIGVFFTQFIGVNALTLAIATGLGVSMMLLSKTTHPPAGANPLLIMLSGKSWMFLISPVLCGAVLIVVIGRLFYLIQRRLLQTT